MQNQCGKKSKKYPDTFARMNWWVVTIEIDLKHFKSKFNNCFWWFCMTFCLKFPAWAFFEIPLRTLKLTVDRKELKMKMVKSIFFFIKKNETCLRPSELIQAPTFSRGASKQSNWNTVKKSDAFRVKEGAPYFPRGKLYS